MHQKKIHHRSAPIALALALLACLGVAACGSSGSTTTSTVAANTAAAGATGSSTTGSSTTSTSSSSTTSSGGANTNTPGQAAPPPGGGPGGGRFSAVRACLAKEGITLPQRPAGQRPGPGGFLGGGAGGGPQLPKGVSREKLLAALRKCGGGRAFGRGGRLRSPAYRQALAAFAACMHQNGVNLPTPNTTGSGPVFDTKGVNTTSSQFKAAEAKCQSVLRSAFPRRPGSGTGGA